MEKHTIESLDQLVHVLLHPVALSKATPEQLTDWLATSIKLKESLRRQLFLDTLYSKSEEEIELLIERHQMIVASMLNLLFNYQFHESITGHAKQFYQQVATQLEDIIVFLKKDFNRFFNVDLNIPFPIRLREGLELKRQWKMIIKTMPGSETNSSVMNILERLITGLLKYKEEIPATYYQVAYLKNLMKGITDHFSNTCHYGYTSLTELLISWNFNDAVFIHQTCAHIRMIMEMEDSVVCRIEFLKTCYKEMSQLLEINAVPFYATQLAAQKAVLDWISHELEHLESSAVAVERVVVNEDNKIQTSVSVQVLALFTRLFKDSGIYTNTNITEILTAVSSLFSTPRQLEISVFHLQNKYYQIDEGTKRKVIDLLMSMAQLCKKL
ncbi:hypothetical protein [Niastella vici]|nr:hypothetical protein [Niastella vici]